MLLITKSKTLTDTSVIGNPCKRSGSWDIHDNEYRQLSHVEYFRTGSVVIEGQTFEHYLNLNVRCLGSVASVGGLSLTDYLTYYGKQKLEGHHDLDFKQWLFTNPNVDSKLHINKLLPAILINTQSEWFLVYIQSRTIRLQLIEESCVIRDCEITTIRDMVDKKIELMEQSLEKAKKDREVILTDHFGLENRLLTNPLLFGR